MAGITTIIIIMHECGCMHSKYTIFVPYSRTIKSRFHVLHHRDIKSGKLEMFFFLVVCVPLYTLANALLGYYSSLEMTFSRFLGLLHQYSLGILNIFILAHAP